MGVDFETNDFLRHIATAGPWLDKKWAGGAVVLGLLTGIGIANLFHRPSFGFSENSNWPVFIILASSSAFTLLAWLVGTQAYLRSGAKAKIGLIYEGHRVPLDDWRRTRRTLAQLLEDGRIKNKVSLRFVPASRRKDFAKRYGFTLITTLKQSRLAGSEGARSAEFIPFQFNIVMHDIPRPYVKLLTDTICHGIVIAMTKKAAGPSVIDLLEMQAQRLHDLLLLLVAVHYFMDEDYDDALSVFEYLDKGIVHLGADRMPRRVIRQLACECCLKRTRFRISDMPVPDELQRICKFAGSAEKYIASFPDAAIPLARVRFLIGDVAGARRATEIALRCPLAEPAKTILYFNAAFLSFQDSEWHSAYDDFRRTIDSPHCNAMQWDDIVDFIDYVADLDYAHTEFLQAFYRKVAGQDVSPDLMARAREWVAKDCSRNCLEQLLSRRYEAARLDRNHPALSKSSDQAQLSSGRPKSSRKQQSASHKRRRTHRKKRRGGPWRRRGGDRRS